MYIGLDVHKNFIAIAIAEEGQKREVNFYGAINNDMDQLHKFLRKQISQGVEPRCVYKAGPCGYNIYRSLKDKGIDCVVIAPSLIPKKNGAKIKTDRRDAESLARLHRAGELIAVYIPSMEDEALRDMVQDDKKRVERIFEQIKQLVEQTQLNDLNKSLQLLRGVSQLEKPSLHYGN